MDDDDDDGAEEFDIAEIVGRDPVLDVAYEGEEEEEEDVVVVDDDTCRARDGDTDKDPDATPVPTATATTTGPSASSRHYAILLARTQCPERTHRSESTERTQIREAELGRILRLVSAAAPPLPPSTTPVPVPVSVIVPACAAPARPATGRHDNQWKIVAAIGPMNKRTLDFVLDAWPRGVRGIVPKAARGEALCSVLGTRGYMDFERVFGSGRADVAARLRAMRRAAVGAAAGRRQRSQKARTKTTQTLLR